MATNTKEQRKGKTVSKKQGFTEKESHVLGITISNNKNFIPIERHFKSEAEKEAFLQDLMFVIQRYEQIEGVTMKND